MTITNTRPNPYVGPRAFRTGEALYGRGRELHELLNLLIAERIVLLHSPSGAGKSSLVYAGLIPRLEEEGFQVLPVARVNQDLPASLGSDERFNRYAFSTVVSLDEALPEKKRLPLEELATISLPDYLERFKAQNLTTVGDTDDLPPMEAEVLIFDQFEEVLTVAPTDLEGKAAFFAQLGAALRDRKRWALFVMREDYIAALDTYLRLVPTRFRNTFRLDLLGVEAAMQAIQLPPKEAGVKFNNNAAQKLVDDLRQVQVQRPDGTMEIQPGPHVEPVQLQVVCFRLWQNLELDDKQISIEDVVSVGDVNQSLREYYDERVSGVADEAGESERTIRLWFEEKLITESGIRSQVLMEKERSSDLDNRAIRILENAHLVRAEKRRGATWFELAHDRLIEPVQTSNAAWFQAHLSLLQRQAALWQKENRAEHLLLREQALEEAESWAAEHPQELSQNDQDFLEACQQLRTREEEAREAAERERRLKLEAAEKVAEAERRRAEEQALAAKKLRTRFILAMLAFIAALFFAVAAYYSGQQAMFAKNFADRESTRAVGNAATAEANAAIAATNEFKAVAAEATANSEREIAEKARSTAVAAEKDALNQKATAEYNAEIAQQQANLARSRELSNLSLSFIQDQPNLALLLSIEAYRKSDTGQALDALLSTLQRNLNREIQRSNVQIETQPISIDAMAISPDGHQLAWAGVQGLIRVYDFKLQKQIWQDTIGIKINQLVFSPDGKILASADDTGEIIFWNPADGKKVRVIRPDIASIYAMDFSPDGTSLAYGGISQSNKVNLFALNLNNLAIKNFSVRPLKTDILSLAWSPDGRLLASAGRERVVRIWDVATEKELVTFEIYEGPMKSVVFSPNGQWLATGGNDEILPFDKNILLWDISLCDRPTDSANQGEQISPWDDPTCRLQLPVSFTGQEADVTSLAFSPDGLVLASGDISGNTRLWDVVYRKPIDLQIPRARGIISQLAFSQIEDNLVLAVGSLDRTISLNNLRNTDSLMTENTTTQSAIGGIAFRADSTFQVIGSDGAQTVLQTENEAGEVNQTGTFAPTSAVYALSKDTGSFAVLVEDNQEGRIEIWSEDDDSGPLLTIPSPAGDVITFSQAPNGQAISETLSTSVGTIRSLALSPDGATLAAGVCAVSEKFIDPRLQASRTQAAGTERDVCTRNEIHLWQTGSGNLITQIPTDHRNAILSLAFSADGRILASGGADWTIYLRDIQEGRPIGLPLTGQAGSVTALAFSPDGSLLASGSSRSLVALWNVASAQLIGDPIAGMSSIVTALAFSPDSKTLVSGSDEAEVAWWRLDAWLDLACKYSQRNLSQQEWEQFFKGEPYRQTCPEYPVGE